MIPQTAAFQIRLPNYQLIVYNWWKPHDAALIYWIWGAAARISECERCQEATVGSRLLQHNKYREEYKWAGQLRNADFTWCPLFIFTFRHNSANMCNLLRNMSFLFKVRSICTLQECQARTGPWLGFIPISDTFLWFCCLLEASDL